MNYTHSLPNLDDDMDTVTNRQESSDVIMLAILMDISRSLGEIANLLQTSVRLQAGAEELTETDQERLED